MATICTHCGREVPPGNTVCQACGENVSSSAPAFTPVVQPGVPSAPPPGYAQSAAPYATQPPPPVKPGGGLKIILIVVGIFVLLGIVAAAVVGIGIWRVSKSVSNSIVHKDSNGDVSITTPNGTITSNTSAVSEADLGVPIFPGATRGQGSSMNMHTPAGTLVSGVFLTSESPSQVVDFYKAKLGSDASVMQAGNSTVITSGGDGSNKVILTITTVESGQTRINILHTIKK